MINVLYIHGANSNANSNTANCLQEALGFNFKIFHPTFSPYYDQSVALANKIIETKNISVVIASSLGAFTAISVKQRVLKILINPCVNPLIELPKVNMSPEIVASYPTMECVLNNIDLEERENVYAVFSKNDELFSHKNIFMEYYLTSHILETQGKHKLTNSEIQRSVIPFILEIFPMSH